jgi:glutaredoxin
VAQDREKAKEMIQKSGQMGVPVIIIDDNEIVVGFNQSLLDKLLLQ